MTNSDYDKIYKEYSGVVCYFGVDDKIIYMNDTFLRLLGYQIDEIHDLSILELINPEDRSEFTSHVYYESENKAKMTVRFYHKNGSHVYINLDSYAFPTNHMIIGKQLKRQYRGFNFDIKPEELLTLTGNPIVDATDLRHVFEDNIVHMRIALDNLPVDFWVKDKNHRYVYMNKVMLKRTQIKEGEYYNKNDFELFDKDIANDFITSDMESIKTKKKTQFTFESKTERFMKWTEVSKVPVFNKNDEYIGIIGIAIDITQSRAELDEVYQANKILKSIINTSFDLVFTLNQRGYFMSYHEELGLNLDLSNETSYKDFFSQDKHLKNLIETGYRGIESEMSIKYRGFNFSFNVKPVFLEDKSIEIIVLGRLV